MSFWTSSKRRCNFCIMARSAKNFSKIGLKSGRKNSRGRKEMGRRKWKRERGSVKFLFLTINLIFKEKFERRDIKKIKLLVVKTVVYLKREAEEDKNRSVPNHYLIELPYFPQSFGSGLHLMSPFFLQFSIQFLGLKNPSREGEIWCLCYPTPY